ncbi:MAG: cytochrome c oxidase subunit II [Cyclobacteriaceae bacterium]
MLNFILIIAVVLIVGILISIFRVTTLIGIAKGESKQSAPVGNKLNALLLLLFLILGLFGFFYYSFGGLDESFIQPIASEHGFVTERLFWITMGITGFVFVLTQIFLFGFSYKYQHGKVKQAYYYPHNNKLEYLWTGVPAVVLAVLILSGWFAWRDITSDPPADSEVVEVMGYQYAWAVRYPGSDRKLGDHDYKKIDVTNHMGIDFSDRASFDDFIPLELHIPKGKPVLLKIRARDVIHSVYMPHFRLQMNAVPGMPTHFWFVPTKSTADMREETDDPDFNYELVCNKICGKGHFAMRYVVVVDEPEDYEKWYAEQTPWLKQNMDYLSNVPSELLEVAKISAGLEIEEEAIQAETSLVSNSN